MRFSDCASLLQACRASCIVKRRAVATDNHEFKSFVVEQLASIPDLACKPMFGGFGFKSRDTFFALIMGNALYFAVDEATRAMYETLGSTCFSYTANGRQIKSKRYFEVPGDIIEDRAHLLRFAKSAIVAARAHALTRKPGRQKIADA